MCRLRVVTKYNAEVHIRYWHTRVQRSDDVRYSEADDAMELVLLPPPNPPPFPLLLPPPPLFGGGGGRLKDVVGALCDIEEPAEAVDEVGVALPVLLEEPVEISDVDDMITDSQ